MKLDTTIRAASFALFIPPLLFGALTECGQTETPAQPPLESVEDWGDMKPVPLHIQVLSDRMEDGGYLSPSEQQELWVESL